MVCDQLWSFVLLRDLRMVEISPPDYNDWYKLWLQVFLAQELAHWIIFLFIPANHAIVMWRQRTWSLLLVETQCSPLVMWAAGQGELRLGGKLKIFPLTSDSVREVSGDEHKRDDGQCCWEARGCFACVKRKDGGGWGEVRTLWHSWTCKHWAVQKQPSFLSHWLLSYPPAPPLSVGSLSEVVTSDITPVL